MTTRTWAMLVLGLGLVAMLVGCGQENPSGGKGATTAPAGTTAAPGAAGELAVLKTFIGGGEGGWDYLLVEGRHVFVSRSTRVMVFDADKGTVIGEIADTPGVHGIAVVSDRNKAFTSNGKDGTVSVVDLASLKTIKTIKAGEKPDAILYDPFSKKVYVFNGKSGDVTIIDPASLDNDPATLAVGGKLEFGATDGAGHVYVNVEDKSELVAIDTKTQKISARWKVAPGEEPTGLAIDPVHRRLFVGCSNQKMIVVDADKGTVLGVVAVGAGVDGVAFDPQLNLAVTSNGKDGTLSAVREGPDGKFAVVQTLKTIKGARTVTVDPTTHRFLLPCWTKDGKSDFGLVVVGKPQ